jgi:hypothetical protein
MTKKRTIPKRPGGKRTIPRRKKAAKVAPEENESAVSESSEELQVVDEAAELHASGTEEAAEPPEVTPEELTPEEQVSPDLTAKVLSSFNEGKLELDTLHDVVTQVYGLSSYVESHKIVLQLRRDGLIVDNGLRKNGVPVFELAAK